MRSAWCALPGGHPAAGRGSSPRWHTVPRCAATPPTPAATGLMHARRRTSAAHVPGTLPRSLRDHTTRHSRHIHPPAGCRGTRRGAAADARLCGPGCSNTAPPAGPARRTAGRRAHSTTPVPSWSCRGRDPAPAPWCRRHAPAPPTSRAAPPPRPADASAVRSVRPSPPASSGRGRWYPPADCHLAGANWPLI